MVRLLITECPSCKNSVDTDDEVCRYCGTALCWQARLRRAARLALAGAVVIASGFFVHYKLTHDKKAIQQAVDSFQRGELPPKPAPSQDPAAPPPPKWALDMVYVSTGAFEMGSPDEKGDLDIRPRHHVQLDAFWIGSTEVTVAQYRRFCKETKRRMPAQETWSHDDHPVVNVTWKEADAFCRHYGFRLPTEAQWEMAARWGGIELSSVESLDKTAWFAANSDDAAHPVGQKTQFNYYGVSDMLGNVWEWTADWFDAGYYDRSPPLNPPGPEEGEYKVARGCSWRSRADECAYGPYVRLSLPPDSRKEYVGLRCAK